MRRLIRYIIILSPMIITAYGQPKEAKVRSVTDEDIQKTVKTLKFIKPEKKSKILIFTLTNGYKHKSIPTGIKALELIGEHTQVYETVTSNDLANFEPDNIQKFDAICFLNTTMEVFSPSKKQQKTLSNKEKADWLVMENRLKDSLMNYIKSGKGFIGFHAATDTFYQWPEYGEMIGGYFNKHPWNAKTHVSIQIEEGQEGHDALRHMGAGNLEFKEEIYQFKDPYNANKLEVLLRLDPSQNDLTIGARKDNDYPVSWVKTHEKGRIFYSSLGHNDHIYANQKVLQHFLNGILWSLNEATIDKK